MSFVRRTAARFASSSGPAASAAGQRKGSDLHPIMEDHGSAGRDTDGSQSGGGLSTSATFTTDDGEHGGRQQFQMHDLKGVQRRYVPRTPSRQRPVPGRDSQQNVNCWCYRGWAGCRLRRFPENLFLQNERYSSNALASIQKYSLGCPTKNRGAHTVLRLVLIPDSCDCIPRAVYFRWNTSGCACAIIVQIIQTSASRLLYDSSLANVTDFF